MGALFCFKKSIDESNNGYADNASSNQNNVQGTKVYSWDKREKKDVKDYILENCNDTIIGKMHNAIKGEQFIVQNCNNCTIYLLDFIGSLTIDDCNNCKFIIGPVKSSVFIRNCNNCDLVVACQQFRTRDCDRITTFISCATLPVIETTTKFKVGPYQLNYRNLYDQFQQANLSPFNCNWSEIHDFTPSSEGLLNYHHINESVRPLGLIPPPDTIDVSGSTAKGDEVSEPDQLIQDIQDSSLTDDRSQFVVPFTYTVKRKTLLANPESQFSCFIIFHNDNQDEIAHKIVELFIKDSSDIFLTKSSKLKISFETARKIFGDNVTENHASLMGPVVYLEYIGNENGNSVVKKQLESENSSFISFVHMSPDSETARTEIDLIHREFKSGMDM